MEINVILLPFTTSKDLHASLPGVTNTNLVIDKNTKGNKCNVLHLDPGGVQSKMNKELLLKNI